MTVHELLDAVSEAGYRVTVNDDTGQPQVKRVCTGADALPAELMAELKSQRDEVLNCLAGCELCGRTVAGREMRERVLDPAFCDRGGAREVKDRNGLVVLEAVPRCPFKGTT